MDRREIAKKKTKNMETELAEAASVSVDELEGLNN